MSSRTTASTQAFWFVTMLFPFLQGQPHSCFHSPGVCAHRQWHPPHTPVPHPESGSLPVLGGHSTSFHCTVPATHTAQHLQALLPAVHSFFHSLNCEFLLWAEHLPNSGLQTHSPPRLPHLSTQNHPRTSLLSFKLTEPTALPSGMFGYLCIFNPNSCVQGR